MKRPIQTAIYYRKSTKEEIAAGAPKSKKTFITVPVKDVFLGVDEICSAILKPTVKGPDGLRYYFACVNHAEYLSL
ncbi:MAG: hypothetical protein J6T35_02120 [Bacteroidales bacterium]|nr:hypothetical protein [Bacteroidales bacterium]